MRCVKGCRLFWFVFGWLCSGQCRMSLSFDAAVVIATRCGSRMYKLCLSVLDNFRYELPSFF